MRPPGKAEACLVAFRILPGATFWPETFFNAFGNKAEAGALTGISGLFLPPRAGHSKALPCGAPFLLSLHGSVVEIVS